MRPRVKIENETPYATKDLRAWTIAALKYRGALNRHPVWWVTWKRSRSHIAGRAYVNTGNFTMLIPSPRAGFKNEEIWNRYTTRKLETLKFVILHEIDHCLGLRGEREMRGAYRADPDSFVKGFPELPWPSIAAKPARAPRGKARPIETKLDEARERVRLYERKEKRIRNLKRKWTLKVRYYEKRQAASGGVP